MPRDRDAREHAQLRYSLWTGDLGLAVYLWDCIRARPCFPTLDVFFSPEPERAARAAGS